MSGIGWLHLSDLHQGQAGSRWLWPNVREQLYDDLSRLHERCGGWDLVLFTGDLTQRGSEGEFALLTESLEAIWAHFGKLGSSPVLLTVPGNHDLVRPEAKRPAVKLLSKWGEDPEVIREFWDVADSDYRMVVDQAFANYVNWVTSHSLPKPATRAGILPGDFSSSVEVGGVSVGIVGLNTAFLQLTGANYEGKLDLDSAQIHVPCDNDAGAWVKQHDVNLLMTHHPPEWLCTQGLRTLHGEIAPPGRFALHLFGHMHKGRSEEHSIGAAQPRRIVQAPSLFGLEFWGEAREDRSHGYVAGRIQVEEKSASVRLWPRLGKRHPAGHYRIVEDVDNFALDNDDAFGMVLGRNLRPKPVALRAAEEPEKSPPASRRDVAGRALNDTADLWRKLLGTDPVVGDRALRDLLATGGDTEAGLFTHVRSVPHLVQVRRRVLKYVATRGDSLVEPILRRLDGSKGFGNVGVAPFLLSAFPASHSGLEPLFGLVKNAHFEAKPELFKAWGYAGGEPSVLLRLVRESSWFWEKLRGFAFRGACLSVARQRAGSLWVLADFVTHEEEEEIPNDPNVAIGNLAVAYGELWLSVHDTFAVWPRGAVADEVLREWSVHEHWRVRKFAAEILGSFGFSRITTPTIEWIKREPLSEVREALMNVLDRGATTMGADSVLEIFAASREGKNNVAKSAWRASAQDKAIAMLTKIGAEDDLESVPALCSLAKLGIKHRVLTERLDSSNYYTRSLAALAVSYLEETGEIDRLRRMYREAGHPHERLFISAALANLGAFSGAELHRELVMASDTGEDRDLDIYKLHHFLQQALIGAFRATGDEGEPFLRVWKRELEPLEPVAEPLR